jgi:microcystin-dependent protein
MATTKVTNRVLDVNSVSTAQLSAGAVTLDKLITTIQQALLPVGAVQAFARTSAPAGWLICNGDAVGTSGTVQGVAASSLTALRNVFLADSNPFGVSGSDPLLPDLRGYFVRGSGTNSDGTAAGTFGAKQADELKAHTHALSVQFSAQDGTAGQATNPVRVGAADAGRFTAGVSGGVAVDAGGTETRPKNIAMLYCIKF